MKEVITMKRIHIFICMAVSLLFIACGPGPDEMDSSSGTVELSLNTTVAGSIADQGEVD